MLSNSKHIIYIGLSIGCISLVYFALLMVGAPLWIIAPAIAVGLIYLYRWLNREYNPPASVRHWKLAILAIGLALLADKANSIALKHGEWDAWAIWNLHARYLADPEHWKNMFLNLAHAHPDYPLAVPSTTAFFNRLLGEFNLLVPFALHYLIMLCIPILIYTETVKKNAVIAALSLVIFLRNEMFITQAVAQMADTLLAFFFLAAIVCFDYAKTQRQMVTVSAAFLGLCMWTKNEGMLLALVFVLFNLKAFLFEWKRVIAGIGLPVLLLLISKIGYAPANDLVAHQSSDTLNHLIDSSRYKQIYESLIQNLNDHYKTLKYLVIGYLAYCMLRRTIPDRRLLIILTCLAGYFTIYVLSHQDLDWHLFTSYHRLLHQLMPATVYIFADKISSRMITRVVRPWTIP